MNNTEEQRDKMTVGISCHLPALTRTVAEVRSRMEHSHEPDRAAVGVQKLRGRMKATARATRSKPGHILAQGLQDASEETRDGFGQLESVKRDLRRQRRAVLPKEPSMQLELVFEDEWRTTGGENAVPFLFHDSGPDSPNRVTVFATRAALRLLSRANIWYMDGTFSMAPKIYGHIYVIRAELGNSAISCVYALICGKHQGVYEELFRAIVTKCQEEHLYPDPVTVTLTFRKRLSRLFTLCLVNMFVSVVASITCARLRGESPVTKDSTVPQFPPSIWNVNTATLADESRTNNICEAWNNSFRQLVGHHHPGVWTTIECLRMDQALTATKLTQAERGEPLRKKQKRGIQQSQIRLRTLCQEFAAGTRSLELFLEAAARNI
ncbi:hypothetical protein ACOMHN_045280 [Nucella lapillus]